ncbi:sulfatase-like hydrolase/transferase [Candidatus Fukatsuia symbiotica]|uniref:sulfatase-like hydrolase/transferase n=1 Tax=Candidatus Fukatsuia TaxID=1927833 RepID=UPI00093307CC|nr:sulfatase-like hydrolase/transferase [Candidatus Fukatsuia symbiotica]MEA9444206.1 sulfatase-like hydrolase/transferase [Candidatus Fukatsuia symbiotica]
MTINSNGSTLFDYLQQLGYQTLGVGYPKCWGMDDVDRVWSDHQPFNWYDDSAQMLAAADKLIANKEQPFALYFWNMCSHLSYVDGIKARGQHSFERWRLGHQSLDTTVGEVLSLLLTYQQLENTVIVGFGDHGDDFWNHGLSSGWCHGVEPYTALVHTPAFIYDARYKGRDINHLVSMLDLKRTVLELLDKPCSNDELPGTFSALSGERRYCFSRNLFINQPDREKGNPLIKGYAITSEFFHLLYSQGKYQMFAWQADAGNHFDLLSQLVSDGNGKKYIDIEKLGAGRAGGPHPHILHFLGNPAVIEDNYRVMHQILEYWITSKQKYVETCINSVKKWNV